MPAEDTQSGPWRTQPDRLMDEGETSEMTGLSKSTHQKLRIKRRGPRFVRLGRAVRYSLWDVQDWLARQRRVGGDA